ncbi:MAG: hypothetical protein WA056_02160 [Gallionella sp.]
MRKQRVKKMEVSISFAATNEFKERLDIESARFFLTKSQVVNLLVKHCLDNNILEELMQKQIENKKG